MFATVLESISNTVMQNVTAKTDRKGIQKNQKYNSTVIDHLSEKFGLSKGYIRQCLNGTRKGLTADTLKKEYNQGVKAIKNALK